MEERELHELKDIALGSDDLDELRRAYIELTEISGLLYGGLPDVNDPHSRNIHKGKLTLVNATIRICQQRIEERSNIANRENYHFRVTAKYMLQKETYRAIHEKAKSSMKEIKGERVTLKSNKLE